MNPFQLQLSKMFFKKRFWDDRTGKLLDSEKVRAARAEELRELDRRVWVEADVEECWNKKGRGPIGVRWVDVDIRLWRVPPSVGCKRLRAKEQSE